jgi:putative transposase
MVNYPKHLSGFPYVGLHRYFLTFCTHEREPLFRDGKVVLLAWTQILRAAAIHPFDVTVYCFMPDHVHLVVEGREETSDLRRFASTAKQYSGYEYSRINKQQKLWQRYSYERVLRTNESTQNGGALRAGESRA